MRVIKWKNEEKQSKLNNIKDWEKKIRRRRNNFQNP
jgi:hypothetical protein